MRTLERWFPGWSGIGQRNTKQGRKQAALYISNSAAAVAVGRSEENSLIAELGATPISSFRDAISAIERKAELLEVGDAPCHLVLAPEFYSLTMVEKPDVAQEEMREAVRWQLRETLDYPPEEATLDIFDLPEAASRNRPMVFAASIRTEFLRSLIAQAKDAGLCLDVIDISELALRNLIYSQFPEPDQGVALLRITSNSGVINISRGEELFLSRRISGVPGEFNENAWAQFHERLALQVQRSVDYYESAMNQPPCSAMLIASTHGWQKQVSEYLQEMLPIPVRLLSTEMSERFKLTIHNPTAEQIDMTDMTIPQANALAAALPALGGLVRATLEESHE